MQRPVVVSGSRADEEAADGSFVMYVGDVAPSGPRYLPPRKSEGIGQIGVILLPMNTPMRTQSSGLVPASIDSTW